MRTAGATDLTGTIVLTGPGRFRHFMYDTRSKELTDLPGSYVDFSLTGPLGVSPDRTSLAFTELTSVGTTRVYVATESGAAISAYIIPQEGWYMVVSWVNDHLLALADRNGTDGTILLLNSRDGSLEPTKGPFPLSTEDGPLSWAAWSMFIQYNSSLTRGVATRFIDNRVDVDPARPMRFTYELWDLLANNKLWTGVGGAPSQPPIWSPSGDMLAVGYSPYFDTFRHTFGCLGIHLVSADGNDRLLDDCSWYGYSWSPDGSLLAAWKDEPSPRAPRLRIYDIANYRVEDYSIYFQADTWTDMSSPPVWSPDGRYIAFTELGDSLEPIRAWFLDRKAAMVAVLMNGVRVEGWMR